MIMPFGSRFYKPISSLRQVDVKMSREFFTSMLSALGQGPERDKREPTNRVYHSDSDIDLALSQEFVQRRSTSLLLTSCLVNRLLIAKGMKSSMCQPGKSGDCATADQTDMYRHSPIYKGVLVLLFIFLIFSTFTAITCEEW